MKWVLSVTAGLAGASLSLAVLGIQGKEVAASTAAANELIRLSDKSKLVFALNDNRRTEWAFTPGNRPGVSWDAMSSEQKRAAAALLKSSLNDSGFDKVEAIRNLEPVLREMENNPGRDSEKYWFMIFGEPGDKGFWSWRYEGHHLSLAFSYRDGRYVSSTPQFLGSNPAIVREGSKKGTRILRLEEELGRSLLMSMNDDQMKQAVLSDRAPADIATSNLRKAAMLEDKGIAYASLRQDQQKGLRELVELYASILKPGAREQRLSRVGDWNKLRFAWMGGAEPGQGHYYRIQGPGFVIEYDNTQNGANHIHTVWRDFDGDFGGDPLADHYREADHHRN